MTDEKQSYFERRDSWQEALEDTAEDLVPVALKLKILDDEIDYLPDPDYSLEFETPYTKLPVVALCMTTKFNEEEFNGKWGYCHIPEDTRQMLAQLTYEEVGEEAWVFYCQRWDE